MYLTSLPEYLNSLIRGIDFTPETECKVNFHWGDEYELNRYLHIDQDDKMGMLLMSGPVENIMDSFPLVWLVSGYNFGPYDYSESQFDFDNVKIVFLKRTNKEWLNGQRWKENFHELYAIGEKFKTKLSRNKVSEIVGNDYSWMEAPNFSVKERNNDKSKIVEYCDALVLKIDKLRINKSCFEALDTAC